MQATILSAKEAAGIDPSKESWQAAPVLVQTTERNDCSELPTHRPRPHTCRMSVADPVRHV